MKKEEYIDEQLSALHAICYRIIAQSVNEENYEDAAAIRDARNQLESVVRNAIVNLRPF